MRSKTMPGWAPAFRYPCDHCGMPCAWVNGSGGWNLYLCMECYDNHAAANVRFVAARRIVAMSPKLGEGVSMFELTSEQVETIGEMADKAENLIYAASIPMPPSVHVQCLKEGLREIRDALHELHCAVVGVDCPVCCTQHLVSVTCGEAEAGRASTGDCMHNYDSDRQCSFCGHDSTKR